MPRRRPPADDADVFPDLHVDYHDHESGAYPTIRRLAAEGGLTIRDLFACHALSGLLASGQNEDLCAKSYAIADRMVEERRAGGA